MSRSVSISLNTKAVNLNALNNAYSSYSDAEAGERFSPIRDDSVYMCTVTVDLTYALESELSTGHRISIGRFVRLHLLL